MNTEQLGKNLKKARVKNKLTQEEVAKKAGITTTYYAMIERGEVNPSLDKIERIIKVLGLTMTVS